MLNAKTRNNFMPSLHMFTDKKKNTSEFCDIEYIKQSHDPTQLSSFTCEHKINDLKGLGQFIQKTRSQTNNKLVLFNAPEQDSRCPELILETAWELIKKNLGRILIVDCDFRTDSLTKNYRLKKTAGVVDYITDNLVSIEQIIKKTNIENVYLVQGGKLPQEKISLLLSEKFAELISRFKADFDYIIFNSAPYLNYIDTFLLSKVLRPIFIQVALNGNNASQLSGIKSEVDVLNLPSLTINSLQCY